MLYNLLTGFFKKYQHTSVDDGNLSDVLANGLKEYRQQVFGELSVQGDFVCTKMPGHEKYGIKNALFNPLSILLQFGSILDKYR